MALTIQVLPMSLITIQSSNNIVKNNRHSYYNIIIVGTSIKTTLQQSILMCWQQLLSGVVLDDVDQV